MELDHKFPIYGCGIVALGLPIHNQTLCGDRGNDRFVTAHDYHFDFLWKNSFLRAECLANKFQLRMAA
jgi:hypothetical protein